MQKLQDGSTDFEFLPIDVNLGRCFRYFQLMDSIALAGYSSGVNESLFGNYQFKVNMRANPTVTVTSNGTTSRLTQFNVNQATKDGVVFHVLASGAGFAGVYQATATASIEL